MPEVTTYNADAISACENSQQAGEALEGLQAMRTWGRMPDVIIHNAEVISACEKSPEAGGDLEKSSACEKALEG